MSRAADAQPEGESAAEDDVEALASTDLALSELVETMERVDWRDVPTISTAEAATLTQRFIEARDAVREQAAADGGDGR